MAARRVFVGVVVAGMCVALSRSLSLSPHIRVTGIYRLYLGVWPPHVDVGFIGTRICEVFRLLFVCVGLCCVVHKERER